jgi:hypothetical protein
MSFDMISHSYDQATRANVGWRASFALVAWFAILTNSAQFIQLIVCFMLIAYKHQASFCFNACVKHSFIMAFWNPNLIIIPIQLPPIF